ncbi:MAG: DNA translocase FtsK 4TM domain-containing protein [Elusimicrobiota bacterium]|jgi:S-DNA-T family DNA segregation ATPase FtsK/SpoIIIE
MRVYYSSAANKKKRNKRGSSPLSSALRWMFAAAVTFLLATAVYWPHAAGTLGAPIHEALWSALGGAAALLPPMLVAALLWRLRMETGFITLTASSTLLIASASFLLGELGLLFSRAWGGTLGQSLAAACQGALGHPVTLLLAAGLGLLGLQVLTGISWMRLLGSGIRIAVDDYRGWVKSRKELHDLLAQAQTRSKASAAPASGIAAVPEQAKVQPAKLREDSPAKPVNLPPIAVVPVVETPKAAKPAKNGQSAAPVKSTGDGRYVLPSLELLKAKKPGAPTGRPSDEEIHDAVSQLDRTLSDFKLDARVSGISPGPVITRYEVSPAPGVTVSSIVARANDIALTMKARGIRMIAPIPGKAAIGIELPNRSPATVTLREVMESPALAVNPAPLAFALGLSSDGTPLSADLEKMPHVLIAGATNSGKSVLVHSLIASILFRRRPDEVKFLLIDPKRIELSLYEGIPHLYDPKCAPKDVRVITNAKMAASSLKALVRVMEQRYEKLQAYRARDLSAFNEEAARRGEREEFRIVVVIDELADLMVVARDVVEDSIQRLTQMARAVGIHIVIATQRPSVDVITGVIKANLPSRVALRVASKVDSKVILDGNGAEALLGKGDMLYMCPGLDPARLQGCFVSGQELAALVDDLRAKGTPDYPLPETAGAVGEQDLSQFNVEPLEFTQALKLVLERRRVSQDLLKSQFGSSARATNLLSLLEVKGFIYKPEGSNRWDIHFDQIEDYLRTHFPQVRLDKPGI